MTLRVLRPGLLTTVQDLGRPGYQNQGVVVGGAVDRFALRVANLLVGNLEGAAALEITLHGPRLHVESDVYLAIGGADLSPALDGEPLPLWRPLLAPRGTVLDFGAPRRGCRAYLAIAGGGFDVPVVLGSRSAYLRAGIGRALAKGDVIAPLGTPPRTRLRTSAYLHPALLPAYSPHPLLRVLRGNQFETFTPESRERFFQTRYTVTPHSDRMGCRLMGGSSLELQHAEQMISEAVTSGTIQVPPAGGPILLLADRQTTGGYPKIGQVAAVDLPLAAQVPPGGTVRFQEISLEEALSLYVARERALLRLKLALASR
ncbi:biotin-dependent carboxyltransferase family protein [Tumebacillus permanentifrigoris]|uniref:Antagonist of KipI n=1 Tax=Tumebacillus permanentifrigoris TaxID=378543 RepID=A0A316DC80_9BACL|nr:biotin-dependent carboxyltransferase family protein [Tumebacillus permanentifrigoris]PWK15811.1 antagonist of KipI [Tumebacillus permanentifrigoris]